MQMHPMMIQQLAELQLSEARDHAAELRRARAARQARLAGTIRPERRLHRGGRHVLRYQRSAIWVQSDNAAA